MILFAIGLVMLWYGHGFIYYYGEERLTLDAVGNLGMLFGILGLFLTGVSVLVRLGRKCTRA